MVQKSFLAACAILCLLLPTPATAACTAAPGQNAHQTFFTDNKLVYCEDGDNWTPIPTANTGTGCALEAQIFHYTGAAQSFVVPAGCNEIRVKAWGAGGGGGYFDRNGGPGGYSTAILPVTEGETLTIVVGRRGIRNANTSGVDSGNAGYGYGGAAHAGGSACAVGHGGGLSGIFRGTPSKATALIIAGGGGGASGYTQGGAGNDPVNAGGVSASMTGTPGDNAWRGGGGGGYEGGTLHTRSTTNASYPSGNGGKGYLVSGATGVIMTHMPEFNLAVPMANDPDYPGGTIAKGGQGSSGTTYGTLCNDAGHGAVVIKGVAAASDGTPTGAVMAFDLANCPPGWSEYAPSSGRFLRGRCLGGQPCNDPDGTRAAGSTQNDELKSHGHTVGITNSTNHGSPYLKQSDSAGGTGTHTTSSTGGAETRPKNVAVLYCRKD